MFNPFKPNLPVVRPSPRRGVLPDILRPHDHDRDAVLHRVAVDRLARRYRLSDLSAATVADLAGFGPNGRLAR